MRTVRTARPIKWVRISAGRRLGYGLIAVILLFIFADLASWLMLSYGRGLLESLILGATLAGGAAAVFIAVTGREQRRKAT